MVAPEDETAPSYTAYGAATRQTASRMAEITLDHEMDWRWALDKRRLETDVDDWAELVALTAQTIGCSIKHAATVLCDAETAYRSRRRG